VYKDELQKEGKLLSPKLLRLTAMGGRGDELKK